MLATPSWLLRAVSTAVGSGLGTDGLSMPVISTAPVWVEKLTSREGVAGVDAPWLGAPVEGAEVVDRPGCWETTLQGAAGRVSPEGAPVGWNPECCTFLDLPGGGEEDEVARVSVPPGD